MTEHTGLVAITKDQCKFMSIQGRKRLRSASGIVSEERREKIS